MWGLAGVGKLRVSEKEIMEGDDNDNDGESRPREDEELISGSAPL